jgi:hypothetical protein
VIGLSHDGSGEQTRGEIRLRVLNSLPKMHQQYLFEEVRKRCSRFLRERRIDHSEVAPEELISEVWMKMLGALVVLDNVPRFPFDQTSINLDAPDLDGRVVWLIHEIGGGEALWHRLEDIRRRRHGRNIPEVGRPLVSIDDRELPDDAADPPIEIGDNATLIWFGLVELAKERFQREDDVSMLMKLFVAKPDLFEESSLGQWPINKIVSELNTRFPESEWRADRVDNAKRRLLNWIANFKKKNGLDQTDLDALLVRIAKNIHSARTPFEPDDICPPPVAN